MVNCFFYCINAFQYFWLQFSFKYTDDVFFYHIFDLLAFLSCTCRQCSLTSSPMTKPSMNMLRQRQPRHTQDIYLTAGIATSLRPCVLYKQYAAECLPLLQFAVSRGPRVVVVRTKLTQTLCNVPCPAGVAVTVFCSVRTLQNRVFTKDNTAEVRISSLV